MVLIKSEVEISSPSGVSVMMMMMMVSGDVACTETRSLWQKHDLFVQNYVVFLNETSPFIPSNCQPLL